EAVGAVVAHDEEAVGRDDEVKAADVGRQIEGPLGRDTRDVGGWDGGEVVAVGVVVGGGGFGGAGFDLLEAVEVEDAAAKVDAVAGNPDDAFNEDDVFAVWLGDGLVEDDGFAAEDVAVGDE